mmetsp:Transcript_112973/g.364743  ORF Transcript_112973/g.364743 Transcript_112973/m.364743 type:complete len:246 (+) Transcript_112973:455-1192(+)
MAGGKRNSKRAGPFPALPAPDVAVPLAASCSRVAEALSVAKKKRASATGLRTSAAAAPRDASAPSSMAPGTPHGSWHGPRARPENPAVRKSSGPPCCRSKAAATPSAGQVPAAAGGSTCAPGPTLSPPGGSSQTARRPLPPASTRPPRGSASKKATETPSSSRRRTRDSGIHRATSRILPSSQPTSTFFPRVATLLTPTPALKKLLAMKFCRTSSCRTVPSSDAVKMTSPPFANALTAFSCTATS